MKKAILIHHDLHQYIVCFPSISENKIFELTAITIQHKNLNSNEFYMQLEKELKLKFQTQFQIYEIVSEITC